MSAILQFTDENFKSEVIESDLPVLVDFWATWCGPCRAVGPAIEELADQFEGTVKVGKLNVEENPQAAKDYSIQSIPAVLLFKNGQIVKSLLGAQSKSRYEAALQEVSA